MDKLIFMRSYTVKKLSEKDSFFDWKEIFLDMYIFLFQCDFAK